MAEQGTLGGEFSYATIIKQDESVVSWSHKVNQYSHACLEERPTYPPHLPRMLSGEFTSDRTGGICHRVAVRQVDTGS
jgi:hypothetical protein